jgi:hypothetical protein
MLQRVVVAQTVAQRLLALSDGLKEPIMGRPASQYLPEALNHLEAWTRAGQPVQGDMGQFL